MKSNPSYWWTLIIIINGSIKVSISSVLYELESIMNNGYGRNAIRPGEYKWPNGVIPYEFSDDYSASDRKVILGAMELLVSQTCIEFVAKTNDHIEHIKFIKANGCGAPIGYRRGKKEPIEVFFSDFCLKQIGAIQHELLHVIGLFHEQCRSDRDKYITILWENVDKRYLYNFMKANDQISETFDLPYDYKSLMHYPNSAFAAPGKNWTMISKKNPNMLLGQTDGPTFFDLEKVRKMYKCS